MSDNSWTKAAKAALKAAGVSQSIVAEQQLGIDRAALTPYLSGARRPSHAKVLAVNEAIGAATNEAAITPYLDCEAVEAGLLPSAYLSTDALINGAFLALDELGLGLLKADWSLSEHLGNWTDERITKFLIALNRDYRKLLLHNKPVPWAVGHATIADVLRRFGLGDLIAGKGSAKTRLDRFRDIVRAELDGALDQKLSAHDRLGIENRLFIAALGLIQSDSRGLLEEALGGWTPQRKRTSKKKGKQ